MIFLYQFICIKTHEYFTYCSKLHSYGWEGGNVTSVKIFFQNEGSKLMPTLSAFMQALHCSKLKGNLIRRGFQEKKKKKKAPSLLVLISSFFCCSAVSKEAPKSKQEDGLFHPSGILPGQGWDTLWVWG